MFGLVAGIMIGTDLGISVMLSGEGSLGLQVWGLQVCGCARFCIDPAVVSSPFLTTAADIIGRVLSVLTKTIRTR
jgi:Mg/Co/Ni transporter MgtE